MSIHVDPISPCVRNANWRYNESCHLYHDADDVEALHQFAQSIGLRREWFQDHPTLPHYDLTSKMRDKAVRNGAIDDQDFIPIRRYVNERAKRIRFENNGNGG